MAVETAIIEPGDPVVEAGADKSFLLDDPTIWYVEEGWVDVFCVRWSTDGRMAARVHVVRIEPGQCLVGCRPGAANQRRNVDLTSGTSAGIENATGSTAGVLQAVGSAGTMLRPLSTDEAAARIADRTRINDFARLIDGWIEGLYAGLAPGALPREIRRLHPPVEASLSPNTRVSTQAGVAWVTHREGDSVLLGRPGLPMNGAPMPCSDRAWFESQVQSVVDVERTRTVLERGGLWTGLEGFHRLAVQCALRLMEERTATDARRQRRRQSERRKALSEAFTDLVTLQEADAETVVPLQPVTNGVTDADRLAAACRLVGARLGMSLSAGLGQDAARPADPVAAIAKASRVRVRRVLLRDRWWTCDNGPLLGRTAGEAPRWVALLPASSGRYEICDPADGARCPVTATEAATLAPAAHTFYRSFPPVNLSPRDVIRFGMHGCSRDLLLVFVFGIAGGLLGLAPPIATGALFNTIIPGAERDQLLQITLMLLACASATGLFELVRRFAVTRVDGRFGAAVQAAVWDRLLSLPLQFFRPYSAGDLAVRAMGIDTMRRTLSGATITAALGALFSLSNYVLLFYYGGVLAWWATGTLVTAAGVTLLVGCLQLRLQRAIVPLQAKASGLVLQLLTGIAKLRVAAAESAGFAQWARLFSQQRRLHFRARTIGNWLSVFNAILPTLSLLVIMMAASASGNAMPEIRTGDYVAFSAAFGTCLTAMVAMSAAAIQTLGVVPIYENARPILDTPPEVNDATSDPGSLTGAIEVHHLTFHYQPDMPAALEDVSFDVRPGEFVAFIGPSGSGKSTLLRVLLGFERPNTGSVYFDGQDLAGLDLQAVRNQVGVVLQSGRIMAGDLFTNIVGSSAHTIEDAWEAARMAGLDDDIRAMPMGMHTVVSDGASTLSGGQRQRLMIARAIVNRPRMLFFDEATSALDNRTQAVVSESLEQMHATRIVVAHRLSTVVNADRICVMTRGRIVQSGRYEDLSAQGGPFAELARRQTT